jgi:SH3-like domain-containing protein
MNIKKYLPVVVFLMLIAGVSACGSDSPLPTLASIDISASAIPTNTPVPSSTPLATWTPLPTSTTDPNPSSTPQPLNSMNETRYINTSTESVNLRSGAGVSFDVVGSLANGSQIKVIGEQTTNDGYLWYVIIYSEGTAWIYSGLTSIARPSIQVILPTQAPLAVVSNCSCSGADLDCSHFSNSVDAQACYNKCVAEVGRDYHRLDGEDNDGWACEMLP